MIFITAIVSIFIGALLTVFTIENSAMASISLLSWHLTAPLAVVIAGAAILGVLVTLISFLPAVVRTERKIRQLKIEKDTLEKELTKYHIGIPVTPAAADAPVLVLKHNIEPRTA